MAETKQRTPVRAAIRERIAGDGNVGQAPARHIPTVGDAQVLTDKIEIAPADALNKNGLAEELAFMEEVLEIVVLPTSDKTESKVVEVGNGGQRQFFIRGARQKVKRKYVECLARAKPIDYDHKMTKDETTGEVQNSMIPREAALKYPFEVKFDPSGARGDAWLQKVLSDPL